MHSIDSDNIKFCVLGLQAYKDGYFVDLSKGDAGKHAMCLSEWCELHPEDAPP